MEQFLKASLVLHIVSGFTALLAGITALIARKGSRWHKGAGKVFFYSMMGVSATAVTIAGIKVNDFLLTIGVFAFFQNYSGYRSVKNKTLKPSSADWAVLLLAAVNSIYMVATLNIVLVVFGLLSAGQVYSEVVLFAKTTRNIAIGKKQWLLRHIAMMVGAFIATTTAFVVLNVRNVSPAWLPWLLPTALLVPITVYWSRKVRATGKTTV